MAETSMFWETNGVGDGLSTGYSQSQLINFFHNVLGLGEANRGVVSGYGSSLQVTETVGGGSVDVGSGAAIVKGFYYENTSTVSVAIPTPASATRIDRIVLRASWAAQTVRIYRLAGTEGGSAPSLTQTAGSTWDLPLAQVSITTAGAITITDERQFLKFGGVIGPTIPNDLVLTGGSILQVSGGIYAGGTTITPSSGEILANSHVSGYLPTMRAESTWPATTNATLLVAPIPRDTTLRAWKIAVQVASPNNSSNYWRLNLCDLKTSTILRSLYTNTLTADTWYLLEDTGLSISLTKSSHVGLLIRALINGTPGGLYIGGCALFAE